MTLLSFPSGLPLGVVLITIPYWLQQSGVDIKTIGLVTAAQIPYAFKFIWSPLIDRFAPRKARKRFWVLLTQGLLALLFGLMAVFAKHPAVGVVAALTMLISFLSATQDIAYDAYAVEVLRREELGMAVGARSALARAGIFVARFVNTLGPRVGWSRVFGTVSALFLPFMAVTALGPEPEVPIAPPRSLRDAIWEPFVGFLRHPRALGIIAFLFFYKYADNLATSLISPFFGQMGYRPEDIGVAQGSIGLVFTILGTFAGGVLAQSLGLGRALWMFGILQALGNLGYAGVAHVGVYRPVMYGAVALEAVSSGMGTGAFSVFLLRLTQRQFSATQYALFSSIFALGRTLAGPPAGFMVDALGWKTFFLITPLCALPGLFLLNRFAPWREREVTGLPEDSERTHAAHGEPVSMGGLVTRALFGGLLGTLGSYSVTLLMSALKAARGNKPLDLPAALVRLLHPARAVDHVDLVTSPLFGVLCGLAVAAYLAARRGVRRAPNASTV